MAIGVILNPYVDDMPHCEHIVDHTLPDLVERAGYLSTEKQINSFIMAGERLAKYRKEAYDLEAGQDDDFEAGDPTAQDDLDLVEAQQIYNDAVARLAAAKAAASEKTAVVDDADSQKETDTKTTDKEVTNE